MADVSLIIRLQGAKDAQDAINKITGAIGGNVTQVDNATAATKRLNTGFSNVSTVGASLLKNVLAPIIAALSGAAVLKAANDYDLFKNRLKLVTDNSEDLRQTQERLLQISQLTGTSFSNNLEVFTRFAQNSQTINASANEILQLTENINKLVVISGASATEANAALIQLSQGFASGEVRGEELRSIMEQLPAVAKEIADQLGLTIGQFRELSFAGKITAEDIKNALVASTSEVEARFRDMGDTAGQAFGRVKNAAFELVGQINEATGATQFLATALNFVAGFIQDMSVLVSGFGELDRITFDSLINALATLQNKITGALGLDEDFKAFAGLLDKLATALEFFGAEGFATNIRGIGDAFREAANRILASADVSIIDTLIPPNAAEVAASRFDAALQVRLVSIANEQLAEEKTAEARKRLQKEVSDAAAEARAKEAKAAEDAQKKVFQLEVDTLEFRAQVNEDALEDVRAYWRLRLGEVEAGTRKELDALEALAKVNQEIAERDIERILDNSTLTKEEQQVRLQLIKDSLEAQAGAVENGALRFGSALGTIDEALKKNQAEMDKTKTAAQKLAEKFNDGFITIPEAVFDAASGIRSSFRGLFTDVFTMSKSLGDALKDFFGNVANAILTSLANVIADKAFTKIFGAFSEGGGSGSGFLGFIGDLFGLATGGSRVVTKRRQPILVGENGPELVSRTSLGSGAGARSGGAMAVGGARIVTAPTVFMAGERGPERVNVRPLGRGGPPSFPAIGGGSGGGGRSIPRFQVGGSRVVSSPTLMMAGEGGPERATFSPLGGSVSGGPVQVNLNAPAFFGGSLGSSQLERQLGEAIMDRQSRRATA